ncbi:MAG: DUF5329 family protein [Bacteroidota bacterium]
MKKILLLSALLYVGKVNASIGFAAPFIYLQIISEEQKIEKLIAYLEKSDAVFIRNGKEYPGKEAAEHLRMKRKKAGSKVKTAKDFIDYIASKSSMSGDAYKMKFKNGSIFNTRDVLYNELRKLEKEKS